MTKLLREDLTGLTDSTVDKAPVNDPQYLPLPRPQLTCLVAAAGRASGEVCVSPIECKSLDSLEDLLSLTGGTGFPTCDLPDGSKGVMCASLPEGDIVNR